MKRNDLIDNVHRNCEHADAANRFPAGTDAIAAAPGLGKQGSEVGGLTVTRVANTIADREYCCHRGL